MEKQLVETKVYVIDLSKETKFKINATDEEYMAKAEELGTVYSLAGFQEAFNEQTIDTNKDVIRILPLKK